MKFTRRDLLKTSGALAALFAARGANGVLHADETFYTDKSLKPDTWKKGVCRYCGTGCGVEVGIKDGKAIAVRGIKDYPVNKGVVCLKGLSLMNVVHSKERAVQPYLKNSNGEFEKISMDKALDTAAKKLNETIKKYGKDSVALYVGAQIFTEEFYAGNKLFKGVIGTNNVEANARVCMASAVTGFLTTFGLDEPASGYGDIEKADTFFIIGSNLAEQHPIIFGRVLKRKAENPNFKLIVADPRFTPTAAHADIWLPFFPNQDLSLLNSMAYVLVKENLIDKKFIDTHTQFAENGKAWGKEIKHDFESYKKFLEDYKPEKVAKNIGVPAEKIIEAAKLFGNPKRATMSLWTMGLNQRKWGTWVNNLMYNIHLITGKMCKPGSTALSMTGQPNACGGAREQGMLSHLLPAHRTVKKAHHREEMEKIWGVPKGSISSKPGLHTLKMFEEVGKKIKFIWIACSNPYQTLPDLNNFIKRAKDAFVVVQDIFPPTSTQDKDKFPHVTAELSDLFIPSAFWIEKGGVFGNTERRSSLTEKMIEPPKGLLTDAEIFIEVAKRMGKGKYFQYKNHEDLWNEYIKSSKGKDLDLSGADYNFLRKHGSAQWPVLDSNEGDTKLRYQYPEDKFLKKKVAEGEFILYKDYIKQKDETEKIENEEEKKKALEALKEKRVIPEDNIYFYGQKNEGKAKIFLRPQKDAAELPDNEYPMYLTTGRVVHHWHTGTMTMRVPWLAKMANKAYIEINSVDAEKMGIENEDMVKVSTRRGSLKLRAKVVSVNNRNMKNVDEKISIPRPGVIFAPFFDARLLVNKLTINAYDAMSKEPEYKIAAARIEKINEVL